MGDPIEVEQQENPSDEYVQQIQDKLIAEMQFIFDANKKYYGWENKTLIIQ